MVLGGLDGKVVVGLGLEGGDELLALAEGVGVAGFADALADVGDDGVADDGRGLDEELAEHGLSFDPGGVEWNWMTPYWGITQVSTFLPVFRNYLGLLIFSQNFFRIF